MEPSLPSSGHSATFVGLTNERDLVLAEMAGGIAVRTLPAVGLELAPGAVALTPDDSFIYLTDRAGPDPRIRPCTPTTEGLRWRWRSSTPSVG